MDWFSESSQRIVLALEGPKLNFAGSFDVIGHKYANTSSSVRVSSTSSGFFPCAAAIILAISFFCLLEP